MPVDIGLYNYVKKSIEEGKSKDDIRGTLQGAQWSAADLNEVFSYVERGTTPAKITSKDVGAGMGYQSTDVHKITYRAPDRPELISMLCGYYFVMWILKIASFGVSFIVDTNSSVSNILYFARSSDWHTWFVIGVTLLQCAAIIMYFALRRWGFFLYCATILAMIVYSLSSVWSIFTHDMVFMFALGLIVPCLVVISGILNFKKLR